MAAAATKIVYVEYLLHPLSDVDIGAKFLVSTPVNESINNIYDMFHKTSGFHEPIVVVECCDDMEDIENLLLNNNISVLNQRSLFQLLQEAYYDDTTISLIGVPASRFISERPTWTFIEAITSVSFEHSTLVIPDGNSSRSTSMAKAFSQNLLPIISRNEFEWSSSFVSVGIKFADFMQSIQAWHPYGRTLYPVILTEEPPVSDNKNRTKLKYPITEKNYKNVIRAWFQLKHRLAIHLIERYEFISLLPQRDGGDNGDALLLESGTISDVLIHLSHLSSQVATMKNADKQLSDQTHLSVDYERIVNLNNKVDSLTLRLAEQDAEISHLTWLSHMRPVPDPIPAITYHNHYNHNSSRKQKKKRGHHNWDDYNDRICVFD